ncbi:uncharacterized protein RSE6_07508 [Rhynchosporium secalis]|uniref:N-acetyltransferase domain-containing protein n=1 Tax=Rhynchosporium secalis TaxID=38038 RepID=A0A1E1MD26_RHYSE|nr:uncharacterized protein RSE6_07508 [Rhynchosporium secalis]
MSLPKDDIQSPLQFKNPPLRRTQPTSQEPILIRRARLFESYHIGRIAARTYFNTPLTKYLSPYREKYYGDYEFGFQTRAQARMFSPRNITYFACEKSRPEEPVGYMQFVRMGDDEFANKLDREGAVTWWVWVMMLSWVWGVYVRTKLWWVGGNRSEDPEAVKKFKAMTEEGDELYWQGREDRRNRWHAQSVVVLEEHHGRGIGKRLMAEVCGRADSEGVVTGLEASASGEWMYRSVGFELLARFKDEHNFGGDGGGVMIRHPKGHKNVDVKQ